MLVLERLIYEKAKRTFDEVGTEREILDGPDWRRMLEFHDAEGIGAFIISHERFPDEFYRRLRKGSLLVRFGVGYDAVPVELCREFGILVANTPGTLDQSVAEHAMTLIAALTRHVLVLDADMKSGRWNPIVAEELSDKTLAIAGFGNIGRSLAKIAKFGFGMRIVAFDVDERIRDAFPSLFDRFTTSFEEAVGDADYVSINMNLNPSTAGFINAGRLKAFRRGAVLVNTSRGGVIDEAALYAALSDGTLSAAGLDVFAAEPYVPAGTCDLRRLPNVLLTPHVSSNTTAANRRMAESAIRSLKAFASGRLGEIPLVPELRPKA